MTTSAGSYGVWTAGEIATLKAAWLGGMTILEAADLLGKAYADVVMQAYVQDLLFCRAGAASSAGPTRIGVSDRARKIAMLPPSRGGRRVEE